MTFFRRFRNAVSFLSVVPVGGTGWTPSAELARSAGFFPAVGLLIGFGSIVVVSVFGASLGQNVVAALVVLFLVVVTGGLHIDGLADTADALAGTRTPERRLEIMRSGSSGPLGVAAVTLVLLLKYSMLSGLAGDGRLAAVLLAPVLARWPMVVLAWGLPSVRHEGLGHAFAGRIMPVDIWLSGVFILALSAIAAYLWGYLYLAPLAALPLLILASAAISRRLLGGITGDILGATVELGEAFMLSVFLVIQ